MSQDPDESLDTMMQHLEAAKQRETPTRHQRTRSSSRTGLQAKMQSRTDVAVLASNYEARLDEFTEEDAVTHRSSKAWKSAKVGFETHGRLPIYYRSDGEITHKGYISELVLNPEENMEKAEELLKYITDNDTYEDYNDRLDTTTFVVTDGERLDESFSQTKLEKLSGDGNIEAGFSRQPAYVVQRDGDFPNFP